MSKSKKTLVRNLLLFLLLTLLFVGAAALYLYRSAAMDIGEERYVTLPKGINTEDLIVQLEKECRLKHPAVFRYIAQRANLDRWLKNGRFRVKPEMTLVELVKVFREGKMKTTDLVIRPLNGLEKFAGKCGEKLEGDSIDFIEIFQDSVFLDSLGFNRQTVYALLLPDTYNVLWHTSSDELLVRLKKEYHIYWNSERLTRAERSGLNPIQIAILASIVAKETNKTDEMPMIAGMYLNRLKINMPLQADPSIKFALNEPGIQRLLNVHLNVVSPYNTYHNKGLPPGPICIPSKQSIEAVLNYSEHNFLYMCAKEDFSGYHNFAKDYDTHLKNAARYRKALDLRGIK